MVRSESVETLKRKSAEDLRAAEVLIGNDDELLTQIGFFLQQFLEKKMKVELCNHKIDYPWTHDLVALLKLFPQKGISEDDKLFAYVMSRFAVESRYSDYFTPPWDGRQMLEKAKKFAEFIETFWEDP